MSSHHVSLLSSILRLHPRRERYNTHSSNDHPGDQNPKVLPQMVFSTEDDSPRPLYGVKEREAVAVAVEVGHQLQGGERACDVDDDPETEKVARPFEADECE